MEPPRDVGMKMCSNDSKWHPGPYMVKTFNITFLGTKMPITLKLGVQHQVLKYCQIFSNDDTGLTLTIFYVMFKFIS